MALCPIQSVQIPVFSYKKRSYSDTGKLHENMTPQFIKSCYDCTKAIIDGIQAAPMFIYNSDANVLADIDEKQFFWLNSLVFIYKADVGYKEKKVVTLKIDVQKDVFLNTIKKRMVDGLISNATLLNFYANCWEYYINMIEKKKGLCLL